MGAKWVVLSGGEPLMLGEWPFELAEEVRRRGMVPVLETNGTLVREHNVALYRSFYSVQISLEGPRTINDAIRGEGSFEAALASVDYLVAGNIKVGIQAVVGPNNMSGIRELAALAREKGAFLGLERLLPLGRAANGAVAIRHQLFEMIRLATEERLLCNDPLRYVLNEPIECLRTAGRLRGGCTAGVSGVCVSSDTTVFPCPKLRVPAGSLETQSLNSIWKDSTLFLRVRNRQRFGAPCGGCPYVAACGGCRAAAWAESGEVTGGDPQCFFRWR